MAEDLTIEELKNLAQSYDGYFTSLAQGKPEIPNIPVFNADILGKVLMTELSDENKLNSEETNDVLDAAKIGFTALKFSKTGKPAWAVGYKLTGKMYYKDNKTSTNTTGRGITDV